MGINNRCFLGYIGFQTGSILDEFFLLKKAIIKSQICIRHSQKCDYISNKRYIKYHLHVSAIILAIIRLYSTYQVAVQYMWYILGRRDLVYNS